MKKFKRALATSLALVLLLSISPKFSVIAAEADTDTAAYNQLMHDYKLNNDLSSVSYSTNASNGGYITEDENGYLKFGNMETYQSSCYTDMKHGLTGATKLVFEAEFCCSTPGFVINIRANNYNSKAVDLIKVEANQLTFMGDKSKMVTLSEGEWYKITVACDLDNHTYDAFVNEKQLIDDGKTANQLTTLTRIRAQINDTTVAGGEFLIRDIKWYTPDETGACPDENKDHVCDYGCSEPVGVCGDADKDGLCDYGCGKVYSPYNDLMHDYKLNNDLSSVSYSANASAGNYITEDENGYLKFGNMEAYQSSCYADMKHGLTGATKLVFEAEFCCSTPGFVINIRANNYNSKAVDLIKVEANQLTFMGDKSKMVTLSEGEWYKITVACDLDNHTYDAFVNEKQLIDDGKTANQLTTLTRIRAQINDTTVAGGEFLIRDIKWYTPDETGACPDENKDHVCDYGCSEPVGECVDADKDGLCDYGCGKVFYHEYKVVNGAIVDEKGNEITEITESGVLDLKGQSVQYSIKVTGEETILSVVDTSWMTNGLAGKNVGQLIVTEGADKIETYTQYGDFKYLKVPGENDTYTFHPFNLTITRMGLNTVQQAISLEVQFVADDVVRDLLIGENEDHTYGLKNLKTGATVSVKGNAKYQFTTQNNHAIAYFALSESLCDDNFDEQGKFQAYMKLKIGEEELEILSNYVADITPRKVMTDLNNSNVEATADQLARIRAIWTNKDGTEKADYSKLKSVLTRFH